MNLVKACYKILERDTTCKQLIERVARVCYKSEGLIKEGSADKLVSKLIERKHYAMLEHATLIYEFDNENYHALQAHLEMLQQNKDANYKSYLRFTNINSRYIVSGNVRAWMEFVEGWENTHGNTLPGYMLTIINDSEGLLPSPSCYIGMYHPVIQRMKVEQLTEEEKWIHEDVTVEFTVDRGVTHEMVRHRDASFAQESTRYCNYTNDKFDGNVKFIDIEGGIQMDDCMCNLEGANIVTIIMLWHKAMQQAEDNYKELISLGASPQIARSVLPSSTASTIVITANLREWHHFFELRADRHAHPQMQEVAYPLLVDFIHKYGEKFKR